MRKIKTFRFMGSSNIYNKGENSKEYTEVSAIDSFINDFLQHGDHSLIDIKIATVEAKHHNNGGYNLVDLIYTIIYE